MTYFELYILACVFAYTWSEFLTAPGEVFDFVDRWGMLYLNSNKLRKLLYECSKCVGGQVALWGGLLFLYFGGYDLKAHLICVLFVIFTLGLIEQIRIYAATSD